MSVALASQSSTRWRAFADGIALVLGINLWLALVVFPGSFVGAPTRSHLLVSAVPLAVLGVGVWRRSEAVLLFGFPSALLLPVALRPEMVAMQVYGPIHFTIVSLGLVAYLFGASVFTSFHEPPAPVSVRPLASSLAGPEPRWRRRSRIYLYLLLLSLAVPATLLYAVNFDDTTREFIVKMYPARAASFTAVLNLGVLASWLILYSQVFLHLLSVHRTGDRDKAMALAIIRAQAKSRRPRPRFYLAAAATALLVGALLLLR